MYAEHSEGGGFLRMSESKSRLIQNHACFRVAGTALIPCIPIPQLQAGNKLFLDSTGIIFCSFSVLHYGYKRKKKERKMANNQDKGELVAYVKCLVVLYFVVWEVWYV